MSENGSETAVSRRKEGVLMQGFFHCGDGLVKATKLSKGVSHPSK
jgi:hypothetical protein